MLPVSTWPQKTIQSDKLKNSTNKLRWNPKKRSKPCKERERKEKANKHYKTADLRTSLPEGTAPSTAAVGEKQVFAMNGLDHLTEAQGAESQLLGEASSSLAWSGSTFRKV